MEPAWLALARAELGVRELPGTPDNPRIIKYWNDAKLASVADGQDEVPWCAAFVGAMLARSQIPHSGKANARSYEAWGRKLNSPVLGCVVVFSRPPHSWQGHVAFYLGSNPRAGLVQVLGGNQSDAVSIASFHMDRVVAWRWPASQLIKPEWVGPITLGATAPMSEREG